MTIPEKPTPLARFNQEIIGCERCPRLRSYSKAIGESKRLAYREWEYWAKPVPSFGDERARVLILGLAPGAHGSNRTGRPFTGDGSGNFLYPVLYESGFASQPLATSRGDGMTLHGCWISAAVRCAPPDNKPAVNELANCADHLDREIALLTDLRVVVCLGRIAFDAYLRQLARTPQRERANSPQPSRAPRDGRSRPLAGSPNTGLTGNSPKRFAFFHGAEYALPGGLHLLASFHPSLQNTNTGRLTRPMFLDIFRRARSLAE